MEFTLPRRSLSYISQVHFELGEDGFITLTCDGKPIQVSMNWLNSQLKTEIPQEMRAVIFLREPTDPVQDLDLDYIYGLNDINSKCFSSKKKMIRPLELKPKRYQLMNLRIPTQDGKEVAAVRPVMFYDGKILLEKENGEKSWESLTQIQYQLLQWSDKQPAKPDRNGWNRDLRICLKFIHNKCGRTYHECHFTHFINICVPRGPFDKMCLSVLRGQPCKFGKTCFNAHSHDELKIPLGYTLLEKALKEKTLNLQEIFEEIVRVISENRELVQSLSDRAIPSLDITNLGDIIKVWRFVAFKLRKENHEVTLKLFPETNKEEIVWELDRRTKLCRQHNDYQTAMRLERNGFTSDGEKPKISCNGPYGKFGLQEGPLVTFDNHFYEKNKNNHIKLNKEIVKQKGALERLTHEYHEIEKELKSSSHEATKTQIRRDKLSPKEQELKSAREYYKKLLIDVGKPHNQPLVLFLPGNTFKKTQEVFDTDTTFEQLAEPVDVLNSSWSSDSLQEARTFRASKMRVNLGARVIQRAYRSYITKKKQKIEDERVTKYVIMIQKVWRTYLDKMRLRRGDQESVALKYRDIWFAFLADTNKDITFQDWLEQNNYLEIIKISEENDISVEIATCIFKKKFTVDQYINEREMVNEYLKENPSISFEEYRQMKLDGFQYARRSSTPQTLTKKQKKEEAKRLHEERLKFREENGLTPTKQKSKPRPASAPPSSPPQSTSIQAKEQFSPIHSPTKMYGSNDSDSESEESDLEDHGIRLPSAASGRASDGRASSRFFMCDSDSETESESEEDDDDFDQIDPQFQTGAPGTECKPSPADIASGKTHYIHNPVNKRMIIVGPFPLNFEKKRHLTGALKKIGFSVSKEEYETYFDYHFVSKKVKAENAIQIFSVLVDEGVCTLKSLVNRTTATLIYSGKKKTKVEKKKQERELTSSVELPTGKTIFMIPFEMNQKGKKKKAIKVGPFSHTQSNELNHILKDKGIKSSILKYENSYEIIVTGKMEDKVEFIKSSLVDKLKIKESKIHM